MMADFPFRRSFKKWLYGRCPGFAGAFPYFGTKIYFPENSLLFALACDQGIFEQDNVRLLQSLARPHTVLLDIGANIGLMSAALLAENPTCRVVACEPSPNVLPYLQRSLAESPYRDRWTLVPKAIGSKTGRLIFHLSDPADSVYDSIQPTQRSTSVRQVEVEVTTVDEIWRGLGSPRISLIKCDVEGAEWGVLQGARECLQTERPPLLIEWNAQNLAAHQRPPASLLDFARAAAYHVYAVPNLVEVHTPTELTVQMCLTESFLLYPQESVPSARKD